MKQQHAIPQGFKQGSDITPEKYQALYQESIQSPDEFWRKQALERLVWQKEFTQVAKNNMAEGTISWFEDGQLNASVNCIDRHLPAKADEIAIIWEADSPGQHQKITYQELHDEVCKLSNAMIKLGIKKGDRVCIYLPMIPEAAYSMLACARIGAVHSVVFGGFSPEALKDRILDADAKLLITADEGVRGGKTIPLKLNADAAAAQCPNLEHVVTIAHTKNQVPWHAKDLWYHDIIQGQSTECKPAVMNAEDPLFILYTSGSTGKPKGVLHSTAGYMLGSSMTFRYALDYKDGEIYWCTADVGWITGHSYIVYGPLANGATTLMFEGVPTWPTASRCWEICDTHNVSIFYTAPTAIRALMSKGDDFVKSTSRKSLRVLGSVGEPINPEAWEWYFNVVGDGRCPIADTWWQTETGSIMMTPMPGIHSMKPGSAMKPFFGIEPVLLDEKGNELEGATEGVLAIKQSWPSQIRGVYNNHARYMAAYFEMYPGYYFTGDGARRDKDGDIWITGRVDDVLNVSGHRLGTAEIESAFVLHPAVAEAAIVGCPHPVKGQGIYAFVTLMDGETPSDELKQELINLTIQEIGPIAKPDHIQWALALPKTRSGKIMRRILRKIGANEIDQLGDTSTLADPEVVERLIADRQPAAVTESA
ncbi:MAG: acetate--CoA ligase [Pseudomonadota bacterium]|nr:acetate--CoA ligase [Pseudomonadota bacterium]